MAASIEAGATLVYASPLVLSETENNQLEEDVLNGHRWNIMKSVVVRMPQLYGPGVVNRLWEAIFESAASGEKAHWIGDPAVLRSLLYVNDAAGKMVTIGKSVWAYGRRWSLAGAGPISGAEFMELAYKAAMKTPKYGHWGRGIMITGILGSDSRKLLEIPYDYYSPFVINGADFQRAFPSSTYKPHVEAIAETYEWFKGRSGSS